MIGNRMSQMNARLGADCSDPDKSMPTRVKRTTIYLIASFIFALAYQIPGWPNIFEGVNGYPMIDRTVYESQLITDNFVIDNIRYFTPIMYFTFEWTWGSLLAYLNRIIGLSPDNIFFLITTFVLWRFSFDVITRAGWIYLPFLINPLIVDFAFSQMRLALAIAFISFVWTWRRGVVLTILIYIFSVTIHTASILFIVAQISSHLFKRNSSLNLSILVSIGALISISIGPLRKQILSVINDRRVDYHDMSSSMAYLSFWIILLLYLLYIFRYYKNKSLMDIRYSIVILSIVSTNILTGGYSTRFIAASFPSLLISMAGLEKKSTVMIFTIFTSYTILLWMYWLRILG